MQMTFYFFFSSPHVTDSGYREVIFISVVRTFEKVTFFISDFVYLEDFLDLRETY